MQVLIDLDIFTFSNRTVVGPKMYLSCLPLISEGDVSIYVAVRVEIIHKTLAHSDDSFLFAYCQTETRCCAEGDSKFHICSLTL